MTGLTPNFGTGRGPARGLIFLQILLAAALAGKLSAAAGPGKATVSGADDEPLDKIGEPGVEPSFPDVRVRDQDGRELKFYSDLVEDEIVVLNFIFTSCRTICPPLGASFGKLQAELGRRGLADRVRLISVSVDPVTDTPQRLKAWSKTFGAGPGWFLVTGKKSDIDDLLKAANAFTADKWDHAPILLMGNDATGRWTRTYGLAPPEQLADLVETYLNQPDHSGKEVRR